MAEKKIRVCDRPNGNGTKCEKEAVTYIILGFEARTPKRYDLCEEHKTPDKQMMGDWWDDQLSVGRAKKAAPKRDLHAGAIRAWAADQDYPTAIPARGRIPQRVKDDWVAAGSPGAT